MKKQPILLLSVALIFVLAASTLAAAQSGGDYDLEWQAIGSAGDEFLTGGDYQIGFTLAQAQDTPISAGGGYQIAQGYWAGGGSAPTAVVIAGFWIEVRADALVACWETVTEMDTLGFNLYRSESGEPGTYVRLNEGLIPIRAPGSPVGAYYEWADTGVVPSQTYSYLLEALDVYGGAAQYGPAAGSLPAEASYRVYLPLVYGKH